MRPEVKWVNTFDFELNIDGKIFLMPGNDVHARLKRFENVIRARRFNIEKIKILEDEIKNLSKKCAEARDGVALDKRVTECYMNFMTNLFLKRDDGRAPKNRLVYDIFMSELRNRLRSNSHWDYFTTSYLNYFNNDKFNELINFHNQLCQLNVNFLEFLNAVQANYELANGKKISKSKRTNIEHFLIILIEDYKKMSTNFVAKTEEELNQKQVILDSLRNQQIADQVEENIVLGRFGFVLETKEANDSIETTLEFVSFPIVSASQNVHTIYDQFKDSYNYIALSSDNKKIKRNSLIDAQLASQVSDGNQFNKALDYHSERDVYLYMKSHEFKQYIIRQLRQWLGNKLLVQVLLSTVDIFTSRYMCGRCQEATADMQNPQGDFMKGLSNILKKEFNNAALVSVAGLRLITRVSADIPFQAHKVGALSHIPVSEVGTINENIILAMDTTTITLQSQPLKTGLDYFKQGAHQYTLFTSSENNDPTKNLILAYNEISEPIKIHAANTIKYKWQYFKRKKNILKQETVVLENEKVDKLPVKNII